MFGRKTEMVDPNLGTWAYVYDGASNVTELLDARDDQKICSFYDDLDRLTEKRYFAVATPCATSGGTAGPTYTYDATTPTGNHGIGRRTQMNYPAGYHTWEYNDRGLLDKEVQSIYGTGGSTQSTLFDYNSDGSVKEITRPNGEKVAYGYHPAGLNSVVGDSKFTDETYVAETDYTEAGQVSLREMGEGTEILTTDYVYDADMLRLTEIHSGEDSPFKGLQDYDYEYDKVGNITKITDRKVSPNIETQDFTFDEQDRLASSNIVIAGSPTPAPLDYDSDDRGNLIESAGFDYEYHTDKKHAARKRYNNDSVSANKSVVTRAKLVDKPGQTCPSSPWVYLDLYVNGVWYYNDYVYFTSKVWANSTFPNTALTGDDVIDIVVTSGDLADTCNVQLDSVTVDGVAIQIEDGKAAFDKGTYDDTSQDGEGVVAPTEDSSGGDTYLEISEDGAVRFATGDAAAYEYDANGNAYWKIVENKAFELKWDEENRLKEVVRDDSDGDVEAIFKYDGDGRRVKAQRDTLYTFYIGNLLEYTEQSVPSWGKHDLVGRYYADGERVAIRQNTTWPPTTLYWVLRDQLDTTSKTIAGSNLTLDKELRYTPWGETRVDELGRREHAASVYWPVPGRGSGALLLQRTLLRPRAWSLRFSGLNRAESSGSGGYEPVYVCSRESGEVQ